MRPHHNRDIAEMAAEWVVLLDDPQVDPRQRRAFVAWLKRSPVHLAEYLQAERTWAELGLLDPERRIDLDALLAQPDDTIVMLAGAGRNGRLRRWFPLQSAMLAVAGFAFAAFVAVLAIQSWWEPGTDYATALGEQRTIRLPDGSSVVLNTSTRLAVNYGDEAREIMLLEGEALFSVQKDAQRPFRVTSDRAIVQAVGTTFVVRAMDELTAVTVLEGEVAVVRPEHALELADVASAAQATRARAGERVDVDGRALHAHRVPRPEASAAWRGGRLVFDGDTLGEVVAEFNRYNRVRLVVDDAALSAERVSGVFDADRPHALAAFLVHAGVVEPPHPDAEMIVLTPRR